MPAYEPGLVRSLDEDPYKHVADLGDGGYGIVDKVELGGKVYARKQIRITTGRDRDRMLQAIQKEFAVLDRLKHPHIIEVVEIFQCKNRVRIIMAQVADTDLKEYMEQVDKLQGGPGRDILRKPMQMWPGCLIQAIAYLHEMRVKHRDLKPANILIMGDDILIADFGVSKDLIDEETTASSTDANPVGTRMYWAPEIDPLMATANTRRGRPVDIFALGCIFLEIATVLLAPPGSRAKLIVFMEINGTSQFRKCPKKLLQWIWFLWGHWWIYGLKYEAKEIVSDDFMNHSAATCDLAFLMLDPNPKFRITARQLTGLVSTVTDDLYYHASVKDKSCDNCRSGFEVNMSNLPLHSIFKATLDLDYPDRPQDALVSNSLPDWETAKKKWLQSHMWW